MNLIVRYENSYANATLSLAVCCKQLCLVESVGSQRTLARPAVLHFSFGTVIKANRKNPNIKRIAAHFKGSYVSFNLINQAHNRDMRSNRLTVRLLDLVVLFFSTLCVDHFVFIIIEFQGEIAVHCSVT